MTRSPHLKARATTTKSGFANNGDTEIYFETVGDPSGRPLVLICGLGSQLVFWTAPLCQEFIDRGFYIIRLDNRDTGLSSKTCGAVPDMEEAMNGNVEAAAYTLSDMADDVVAVLDALGIEVAHVAGTSLGGTIAQTLALDHASRVLSLTSIMSGTGPDRMSVGRDGADADAVSKSLTMDMTDPATYVDTQVEGWRATAGPLFESDYYRDIIQRAFDRSYHPEGWSWQMLAMRASGDRTERLASLQMPSLVIHGAVDPLVPIAAGRATADAIVGARLLIIDDMGHDWPRQKWPEIAQAIAQLSLAI